MFYRLLDSLSYLLNVLKNLILAYLILDKKVMIKLLQYYSDELEFWMIAVTMVFQHGY